MATDETNRSVAQTMELLLNGTPHNHSRVLDDAFSQADEILISVAYLKTAGLKLVSQTLRTAIERGAHVKLFCGLDFWITDPAALRAGYELFRGAADATLYICRLSTNFHPKIYCAVDGGTGKMTLLIGSANLSHGGLRTNVEASAVERVSHDSGLAKAVRRYFDRLLTTPGVAVASAPAIYLYEQEWAIHRKHALQAERSAKKEIAKVIAAQPSEIRRWLTSYLDDQAQQAEFKERVANYRQALILLNALTDGKAPSQTAFAAVYDRLVGGAGRKALWASGGLHRARESVAAHSGEVIAALHTLKGLLNRGPKTAFATGSALASRIPGLGPNMVTEALTTWKPTKYPVLNRNPVASLKQLGLADFPGPNAFNAATYATFAKRLDDLRRSSGFESMIQVNHFLNYVYWKTKSTRT